MTQTTVIDKIVKLAEPDSGYSTGRIVGLTQEPGYVIVSWFGRPAKRMTEELYSDIIPA